jgi:hypothetical protein
MFAIKSGDEYFTEKTGPVDRFEELVDSQQVD